MSKRSNHLFRSKVIPALQHISYKIVHNLFGSNCSLDKGGSSYHLILSDSVKYCISKAEEAEGEQNTRFVNFLYPFFSGAVSFFNLIEMFTFVTNLCEIV